MLTRLRRQSVLLDRYCAALRRDRRAAPPSGLDPNLASVAERVEHGVALPDPADVFVDRLWQRLEAPPVADIPAGWRGPAVSPRQGEPLGLPDVPSQPARIVPPDAPLAAPIPFPQRRWARETLKLVAAALVFGLIGTVLALTLRDDRDQQQGAEPTVMPTAIVSPTVTSQAVVPTTAPETPVPTELPVSPTSAPTATPTAVPTPAPSPFAIEAVVELPEGYDFAQMDRVGWAAFGGSDQNAVTLGWGLAYQDAGVEACFVTRPELTVHHLDGSTETMSTDIANPTIVQAGDWYVVPPDLGNNCRNNQPEKTSALGVTVTQGDPGPPGDDMPGGVSYEFLTRAEVPGMPTGQVRLTLQRVVLTPGEALPVSGAGSTLLYVEAGSLTLANAQGDVTITRDHSATSEPASAGSTSSLAAGDGAVLPLESGTVASATGDGLVSVIVATIEPAE